MRSRAQAALRAVMAEVTARAKDLTPWEPASTRGNLGELIAEMPSPGCVTSREVLGDDFERVELSNGRSCRRQ